MERLENFKLNGRIQFMQAVYGNLEDLFLINEGRFCTFYQALYLYLKDAGFEHVIFYNTTEGFTSFDRASLESIDSPDEQVKVHRRAKPVSDGRPFGRSSSRLEKVQTVRREEDPQRCVTFQKGDGFFQINKQMGQEAIISRLMAVMRNRGNTVLILKPNYEREFQSTDRLFNAIAIQQMGANLINSYLLVCYFAHNDAEFVQLFKSNDPTCYSSSFFMTRFLDADKPRTDRTFYVSTPKTDEIRTLLHRERLLHNREVVWTNLDEIVEGMADRQLNLKQQLSLLSQQRLINLERFCEQKIVSRKYIQVDFQKVEEEFSKVKGQQEVCEVIKRKLWNWTQRKERTAPLSFFAVGTSGVGKTFTAECLSKALSDNGFEFVPFKMSEFASEHDISKIIGSPTGYVGSQERPRLFQAIRRSTNLVICFDEIEKADDKVIQGLMELVSSGSLSWNNEVGDFRNCIIFFTSNLKREAVVKMKQDLMEFNKQDNPVEIQMKSEFQNQIRDLLSDGTNGEKALSPELCSKTNNFLVFNKLKAEDIISIALINIRSNATTYGLDLQAVSADYLSLLAINHAYSPYGARTLKSDVEIDISGVIERCTFNSAVTYNLVQLPGEKRLSLEKVQEKADGELDNQIKQEAYQLYQEKCEKPQLVIDYERLREYLSQIRGQEDIIDVIERKLRVWSCVNKHAKPLSFFSVGTSGVGKTFTCEQLAKALDANGYHYLQVAMNEYTGPGKIEELLGGSHKRVEPKLASLNRLSRGKLVICFDELEKGPEAVIMALMRLLDQGRLTINGIEYDFTNSIIIMTSNLEREKVLQTKDAVLRQYPNNRSEGLLSAELQRKIKDIFVESNEIHIRPEFWGRIDSYLIYNSLGPENIINISLQKIHRNSQNFRCKVIDVDIDYLVGKAKLYSNNPYGVRDLESSLHLELDDLFMIADKSKFYKVVSCGKSCCLEEALEERDDLFLQKEAFRIYSDSLRDLNRIDEEAFRKVLCQVYCQQDKVESIVENIVLWYVKPVKRKPLSQMMVGTSGTGKTYTTKLIAQFLKQYGYEYLLLPMNEYSSEGDAWKLLGSTVGYKDSDKPTPIELAYEKSSRLVIVFDEIEKANPVIFTSVMTLLEEGVMQLRNRFFDFKECIIFFTSNLCMEEAVRMHAKMLQSNISINSGSYQSGIKQLMKQNGFRTEVLGRINNIYVYNPFDKEGMTRIVYSQCRSIASEYGVQLNRLAPELILSVTESVDPNLGARQIGDLCNTLLGRLFYRYANENCLFDVIHSNGTYDLQLAVVSKQLSIEELLKQ